MNKYFGFNIALLAVQNNLFAAEAGMPQLDPKYWASQAFWLILVFTILYISIAKFYLPKIKNNLDDRENKIKDDIDDANKFKELSESKFKEYEKPLRKYFRKINTRINTRTSFTLPRITRYLNQQQKIFFPHWHTHKQVQPGWNRALQNNFQPLIILFFKYSFFYTERV